MNKFLRQRALIIVLGLVTVVMGMYVMYSHNKNIALHKEVEAAYGAMDWWKNKYNDPGNGVKANGFLSVSGTQLVNQFWEPLQLRGMSSHGIHWFPLYLNTRAILSTKSRGANLFRVAMYADSIHGGYNENEEAREINKKLIYMGIENALAADMYVIADWHLFEDQNPMRNVESAAAFFHDLSLHYGDEPGIIYEICNEPNGDTSWEDVYQYASRIIPVIRANAPHAIILVGTPEYSTDILSVLNAPLHYENIMYSYHLYTGASDGGFKWKFLKAWEAGLPVFVSEWGISADSATGVLDTEEAYGFIEFMRQHKISWANWSLNNFPEDYSALKSDVHSLSGWTNDDLSVSGSIIFEALSGEKLASHTAKSYYDLSYGQHEANRLDIMLPDDFEYMTEPVNAVLVLHWGGWRDGDKANDAQAMEIFRNAGLLAAGANYRMLGDGANAEDMLQDIHMALAYIKKFYAEKNVETGKIFLMGNSAGAHLALLYSYKYRDESPIPIAFAAGLSSPTDFTDPAFYAPDFPSHKIMPESFFMLAGLDAANLPAWREYAEELRAISPIGYVHSAVPTLLAHGRNDDVVPVSNSERLNSVLLSEGVETGLYIFPNSGHGLENPEDVGLFQSYYNKLFEYINKYM